MSGRAEIRFGDWAKGLDGPFDLIVANPPYVRSGDIAFVAGEARDYDPRLALDGGADGLDSYRALAPEIARLLAPAGWFFFEVGAGQAEAATAIARAAGLVDLMTRRDLAGIERVVGGRSGEAVGGVVEIRGRRGRVGPSGRQAAFGGLRFALALRVTPPSRRGEWLPRVLLSQAGPLGRRSQQN